MKRALLEQARRAGLQLSTLPQRHAALTAAIRALEEERELAMLQLQRLEGHGPAESHKGIRGKFRPHLPESPLSRGRRKPPGDGGTRVRQLRDNRMRGIERTRP